MPKIVRSSAVQSRADRLVLFFSRFNFTRLERADQLLDPVPDEGTGGAVPQTELFVLNETFFGAVRIRHFSLQLLFAKTYGFFTPGPDAGHVESFFPFSTSLLLCFAFRQRYVLAAGKKTGSEKSPIKAFRDLFRRGYFPDNR